MSDSGEQFFRANKGSRTTAFHFAQGDGQGAIDGDQSAYLHPTPAVLGTAQKVTGDVVGEAGYESTTLERSGRQPGHTSYPDATDNR